MAAGPSVRLVENFVIISVVAIILGKVFDYLIVTANLLQLSGDALNTMTWFKYAFAAFPFLYLIALGLNHLVEANNESSRGV